MNRTLAIIIFLVLLPFLLVIYLIIFYNSKENPIFKQIRTGIHGNKFTIFKFKTMKSDKQIKSQLTVGNDKRITTSGKFFRKTKIDELPQLLNIILGDMNFIGHRPEVPKYASLKIYEPLLKFKPGIIDLVSVKYRNESYLLALQADPEQYYIHNILPDKVNSSLEEYKKPRIKVFKIIILTYFKIFYNRIKTLKYE
jgi:lipopolysaccharide/colanic/teichoic acid biosynthesis glycosyltransferase